MKKNISLHELVVNYKDKFTEEQIEKITKGEISLKQAYKIANNRKEKFKMIEWTLSFLFMISMLIVMLFQIIVLFKFDFIIIAITAITVLNFARVEINESIESMKKLD
jgi:hypothetical protein